MTKSRLCTVEVAQNAYVVPDIEAACRRLHELYGIGPFFRVGPYEMRDVHYRGAAATEPVIVEAAFAVSGPVQIELVRQHGSAPSIFRDMYGDGDHGFHHIATWTQDFESEKQAFVDAGYEVAMEISGMGDYRVAFIDARKTVGHMIELYPDHPVLRAVYASVLERTRSWDGRKLVLPFAVSD
jgi:hypothetical protein